MTPETFLDGRVTLYSGDNRAAILRLADNSIDSVVTDPPYALVSIAKRFGKPGAKNNSKDAYQRASAGFMGKQWDTGETAFSTEFWAEIYRVLKPGGHVIAASSTRTYHRLASAIEDAGFEIRDQILWLYSSGFPKSLDVAKTLDKAAGHWRGRAKSAKSANAAMAGPNYGRTPKGKPVTDAAREWQGWGTALKPACEPWVLARKPLTGTVATNVLEYGTGAINIDGCRVYGETKAGRHPANVIHDGSDEVLAGFPCDDSGSAARFFYSAKADADDRLGSKHPTVKPVALMQYLCRLVLPPGGTVLDPFAGTGTTGQAAWLEGFSAILMEREAEYCEDIRRRMTLVQTGPATRARESFKANGRASHDAGPLFGGSPAIGGGGGRKIYGHFADQDEQSARQGSSGE